MKISKDEYFFYEWLILGKGLTEDKYKQLTPGELDGLKEEYESFKKSLN